MRGRSRPATCRQTPVMTSVLGPMPSAGGPRAEALAQVGGLDESFLLYAEETDWARRAANLGWRHALVPQVTARHLVAGTRSDSARRDAHFHASQERHPVAVPLLALPLLYGAARLSVGGTDVSVSDAALGVTTLTVLVFSRHPPSPALRSLLWLTAPYQTATLFTVIANPFRLRNYRAAFHTLGAPQPADPPPERRGLRRPVRGPRGSARPAGGARHLPQGALRRRRASISRHLPCG